MVMICVCGEEYGYNMGNGKTAYETLSLLLDYSIGLPIASNFHLNRDYIDYTYLEDIDDCNNYIDTHEYASVNLDELSNWFDCYSRPSEKNGTKKLTDLAKQTRKMEIKCRYTAQYFGQVNKALRMLTHKVYVVSKYHLVIDEENNYYYEQCFEDYCYKQHYIGVQEYKPYKEDMIQMSKMFYYKIPKFIFDIYNTKEKIQRKCVL